MLKRIKTLLKANIFIIAIFITAIISYLSLMKISFSQPKIISNLDKWEHCIAYFTLSFCWLLTFYKKPKKKYIIVIACIIFGIVIEVLLDKLTTYRTADYLDIVANTIGVLLALLIFNIIFKKNKVNLQ
jgi:VanZ family protein